MQRTLIDTADMAGGGKVELHEHEHASGARGWLFLVSSSRNVGGSTKSETSGFPTIELAREAFDYLRTHRPPAGPALVDGGTTHGELRGRHSLGGTPGGPPDVEQVWIDPPGPFPSDF